MEIKPKSSRMHGLIAVYDIDTGYFTRALDGISDEDAHNRKETKANHIAWLAGSLVQQRFDTANMLEGSKLQQNAHEFFKDYKGIQDNVTYPSLDSYKKDWETISPILRNAMVNATDEKLESLFEMPDMKYSYYEMLCFSAYRESSIIGQIALWRRLLDYPAMKYD